MYNIKQAAARAGVTVPVMRAWERRYGIVEPARTPSGYRQFDDAAVERVRSMRALVEAGWSPSAAAAAILSGEAPSGAADGTVAITTAQSPASELGARFVAAAQALDTQAVEAVLDDMFATGSFERVAMDLLFPALHSLGDAWAAGTLSVAGEHLASNAVLRRLALALDGAGAGASAPGPRILVGLPPGGRHELGALAFAVAARRAGLPVAYLGADLPVADWAAAAQAATAVVIGVVTAHDRRATLAVAKAVRSAAPEAVIAFGGEGAPDDPAAVRLPADLVAATETLRGALT
jgi:DNA-binding transcriptional MerR regulator/methylmalonyl-CoA mutase cobalamin-binding subunit